MKYYLVDTENVARHWVQYAEEADAGDIFLLFYSKNVGAVSMSLFGPACLRGVRFSFIECYVGPSAMDFQIATELGHLVTLHPDDAYVIISKDKGFDPVVRYWRDRGIRISREAPAAVLASGGVAVEYQTRLAALGITGPDLRTATDILILAMRLPEKKRRTDVYTRFLKHYGRQDGLSRYNTVKHLAADIAAHGPFPPAVPETASASGAERQPSDNPADRKTAGRPGTLGEAISALDIKLSGKQLEKLSNIFRNAYKLKNSKTIYKEQLSQSFGSSEGTRIFEATEFLL